LLLQRAGQTRDVREREIAQNRTMSAICRSAAYPDDDATLFKILAVVVTSLGGNPGFTCELYSETKRASQVTNEMF
jgi:hypothetical protein